MQRHNEKAQQLVKDQLQARLENVVTEFFRKEKDKNVTGQAKSSRSLLIPTSAMILLLLRLRKIPLC